MLPQDRPGSTGTDRGATGYNTGGKSGFLPGVLTGKPLVRGFRLPWYRGDPIRPRNAGSAGSAVKNGDGTRRESLRTLFRGSKLDDGISSPMSSSGSPTGNTGRPKPSDRVTFPGLPGFTTGSIPAAENAPRARSSNGGTTGRSTAESTLRNPLSAQDSPHGLTSGTITGSAARPAAIQRRNRTGCT